MSTPNPGASNATCDLRANQGRLPGSDYVWFSPAVGPYTKSDLLSRGSKRESKVEKPIQHIAFGVDGFHSCVKGPSEVLE